MIPIYLFNASPWGSLTKGYRLLNPLSQREMREKNLYNTQRWRALLSSCIIHASWSLCTSDAGIQQAGAHIQKKGDAFLPWGLQKCSLLYMAASFTHACSFKRCVCWCWSFTEQNMSLYFHAICMHMVQNHGSLWYWLMGACKVK